MVYKHYFKHYALFSKILILFYCFEESALVIFCSMRALVASGEKPKAFPPNRNLGMGIFQKCYIRIFGLIKNKYLFK